MTTENNTCMCVHAIICPTGIQGWIPKTRFNNATQILPVRKKIPAIAQKRSITTTTDKAKRPTKQVKFSPLTKLDMTTEEYNSYLKTKLKNSDTIPAKFPVRKTVGKSLLGLMCPNPPYAKDHEAVLLLQGYAHDWCSVDCGDNWSREHIELIIQRCPQRSALAK